MLVAAAFVPAAPILVPEIAAGAAHELDDLREACDAAVETLLDVEADLLVVVAAADRTGPFPADCRGSFAGLGVDLTVGDGDTEPSLPLGPTMGRWWLDRANWSGAWLAFGVAGDTPAERCRDLGAGIADRAPRVAALAVGDASARRSPQAPGAFDPSAEPFDAAVDAAVLDASGAALLSLDAERADALLAAGRTAWQVVAGMAGAPSTPTLHARLLTSAAPYGVHYLVATWEPS